MEQTKAGRRWVYDTVTTVASTLRRTSAQEGMA